MEVTGKISNKEWEIFIEHYGASSPFPHIHVFPRLNPHHNPVW